METRNSLSSQIALAGQQVKAKGKLYQQLMTDTFHKSTELADELLECNYSLISYVPIHHNPFDDANLLKRVKGADCISKVRHVYWNKGNRLALGFLPHKQGLLFLAIFLSMHPIHSGIRVYFGNDDNTVDQPESAWDAEHTEDSSKALSALLYRGVDGLITHLSSIEMITTEAYRFYEAGAIKLMDVPEESSPPTLKPKSPIGFVHSV